jgi:hypothetical protein
MVHAIETKYSGCLFRSRIEARWAVFFNSVGLEWRYEPEGFKLRTGEGAEVWYLPDFYLPSIRSWVEIKGAVPTTEEDEKCFLLADAVHEMGDRVFIFTGDIPYPDPSEDRRDSAYRYFPDRSSDFQYWFCECHRCGTIGLEFNGRGARIGCCSHDGCGRYGSDKCYLYNSTRLLRAYEAARSERFGC